MTDRLIDALTYHGPLIAAGCLAVGLLGAVAVVVLDRAEQRMVRDSHEPMGGEE